jgi:hypothetical protein
LPYIGNTPAEKYAAFDVQYFTTSATASYTLDHAVANELDIRLVINNVIQEPGSGKAYTATGTTLTLSAATAGTDTMYCVYTAKASQTVNPPAGSVGTSQLADDAVNSAKLSSTAVDNTNTNSTLITAQTAKTSLVDADKFLISDSAASGALKYVESQYIGGGSFVYLGGINSSNHNANKLALQQVFANDYRRYKVMGKFQGTGAGADIEFRWLNSSNSEMTSSYYVIAGGTKSNSASISAEEWFNWNTTGAELFQDTATGSHIHSFTMDLFPNQNENVNYPSAIFHTQGWDHNSGGNRQRVIEGAIYNEFTTSIAGGGIQLESSSGLFGTVNMSIWGYKDS